MPAPAHRSRKGWVLLGVAPVLGVLLGILYLGQKSNASTLRVAHELLSEHPKLTANGRVAFLSGTDPGLEESVRNCRFSAVTMNSFWIFASHEPTQNKMGFGDALQLVRAGSASNLWILSRHVGIKISGRTSWILQWELARIPATKP